MSMASPSGRVRLREREEPEWDTTEKAIRSDWLRRHVVRLVAMLEAPMLGEGNARQWYCHYFLDNELLTVKLSQTIPTPPAAQKVTVEITRGFGDPNHHVDFLSLTGRYRLEDVVAFLRFDRVPPSQVVWEDMTEYRPLALAVTTAIIPNGGTNGHTQH